MHQSLDDLLGQRPFAYVPQSVARAGDALSHGAVALFVTLSALADEYGCTCASAAELGGYMNVAKRSIQKWSKELARIEGFTVRGFRGYRNDYDLGQSRQELIDGGSFARVPLVQWNSDWSLTERRVWIALWSYSGKSGSCWPAVSTLAIDCSVKNRRIQAATARLRSAGFIHIDRLPWQSNTYLLWDGETMGESMKRRAAKRRNPTHESADSQVEGHRKRRKACARNDTPPAQELTPTCAPDDTPLMHQTTPYLDLDLDTNMIENTFSRCAEDGAIRTKIDPDIKRSKQIRKLIEKITGKAA